VCGTVGSDAWKGIALAWGDGNNTGNAIKLVCGSASMTTAAIMQKHANKFFILANLRCFLYLGKL
jgi:hypothetical protein